MLKKYDYSGWSKEDLIKRVHELEKRKKYGLVWDEEREPEQVVLKCKKELPVLKELKEKAIKNDPDKPTHILIEGDNYHALSVLNYTHENSVDVIYIDPPYNTGKQDFTYNDKYVEFEDSYKHSKWISFIEKRLILSRNLLKNTGVIFISIDDYEVAQLKLLCDEIFLEKNLINILVWQNKYTIANDAKFFSKQHEYVLCYAKNIDKSKINLLPRIDKVNKAYKNPDNDPRGPWKATPLHAKSGREENIYEFTFKNGIKWKPPIGTFPRFIIDTLTKLEEDNRIWFGKTGKNIPNRKTFLSEVKQGVKCSSLLKYDIFGHTHKANVQLSKILGRGLFSNPKPFDLISNLIRLSEQSDESVVLDFFAGSGTTGQAVLELNKSENGSRRFILCTNNENDICNKVTFPRNKKFIEKNYLNDNVKYYQTDFVPAESTDENKEKLTKQSVEMLCLRENTFELVLEEAPIKIFQNKEKYNAILFDQLAISKLKEIIKDYDKPVHIYIFSLGDDDFADEFLDMKYKVTLKSIPTAILRVYRRIFK